MIQLHRLEGFYWVAKTGGYARAARAFPYPITQPAVHQQVKKLETELDLQLFERVSKDRMLPTPAGRQLFAFIEPFFTGLPAVLRALAAGDLGGELRIHAETLMVRHLLPDWLKRLRRRCPDARIELRELSLNSVAPLREGEADMLVAYLPDPPDDVATQPIARLHPVVVVPRGHAAARSKRLDLPRLADDTFIAYHAGLLANHRQMLALRELGVVPGRMLTASSADTILGFVESGLGWSIVPSLRREGPRIKGIACHPLPLRTEAEFLVVAAWRKDTPENALLDAALECAPTP